MRKLVYIVVLLACAMQGQTLIDLTNQTKNAPGTNGQLLFNNNGGMGAEDPIISENYVTLLSGVTANATHTATYTRIPNFSTYGTLSYSATGITGSPSGCTLALSVENNLAVQNSGTQQTISFTPGNNYQSFVVNLPPSYFVADMMGLVYNCGTFPTAGTINLVFTPAAPPSAPVIQLPTYRAVKLGLASVASATDIAILNGNATNTVYVKSIKVTCTQTTSGIIDIAIIKRSTANSGGTSASMTNGPLDSNDAAASSVALSYTANATSLGTTVATIDAVKLTCLAPATAGASDISITNFGKDGIQPLTLHGTAEGVAVNLNSVTVTGGSFSIVYEWQEKP